MERITHDFLNRDRKQVSVNYTFLFAVFACSVWGPCKKCVLPLREVRTDLSRPEGAGRLGCARHEAWAQDDGLHPIPSRRGVAQVFQ